MKAVLALVLSVALTAGSPPAAGRSGAEAPAFRGTVERIDTGTRARMTGVSWHRGCPVGFAGLRLLTVSHWGFDGRTHRGRLVVNRDAAAAMLETMHSLYRLRFPIRQMRLVDAYGADDHRSMAADNTSAFNCRFVAGSDGVWSEHAYGRALDLNPLENPYVTESGYVSPPAGAPFADRSRHRRGMVHRGGPVVAAFAAAGWEWGGNWPWPKDYQHFSATGH
ncbi:MAG TPA: M15 family metallopeptidase [Solirubrobacterales bacterium]|nr:M15 family metallopeptidase [Solirubrobacterales bacterium]